MSLARVIRTFVLLAIFLWLFSLLGCAVVSETRTVKNPDGSTTTTDSKRVEYRPSYSYAYVAPVVPYGVYVPPVYVAPQYHSGHWALPIWTNGVPVCRGGRARLINRRCYFY